MPLTENHQSIEAFRLDRDNKPLGVGIQIRAPRRKSHRLDSGISYKRRLRMSRIDSQIAGVIFDLNGTLVERDSESDHLRAIRDSWLIQRGADPAELRARSTSGATTKELLHGYEPMEFSEHRAERFDPGRLRRHPETRAILHRLTKNRGLALAVLTNNVTRYLERCLEELHWESFFTYARGCENGVKPDRQVFLEAIQALGTCACKTVAVGDRPEKDIVPLSELGGFGIELSWRDLGELEERIAERRFSHAPAPSGCITCARS